MAEGKGYRSRATYALGLPRLLNVPRTFNSLPLPVRIPCLLSFNEKTGRRMSSENFNGAYSSFNHAARRVCNPLEERYVIIPKGCM